MKEEEKWKVYRNVKMEWIQHHNPDLVVTDANGKEKERIDLNGKTGPQVERLSVALASSLLARLWQNN